MAAFHNDMHMLEAIRKIVSQASIKTAIETGTFCGDSARELSRIVPFVHTIEIREDFRKIAEERDTENSKSFPKVLYHLGSSDKILPYVFKYDNKPNYLFFLDAHWQDYWPLADELKIINAFRIEGNKVVTIIDDFEVPGRPNFYGSNGGGGTIGDAIYGPRTQVNDTPCSMKTYRDMILGYKEIWFPCYKESAAGYVIASDFALDLSPTLEKYAP